MVLTPQHENLVSDRQPKQASNRIRRLFGGRDGAVVTPTSNPDIFVRLAPEPPRSSNTPPGAMDDATTPTNETFARSALALASQKPLPNPAFPSDAMQASDMAGDQPVQPQRVNSGHTRNLQMTDDMKKDHSDSEAALVDDTNTLSDDESINADGSRPSKKKKSQRFYCTDYPPCNLSFTRSEHLARHIRHPRFAQSSANTRRKHTGERPFQCHCSRRFSRLDNLRQHAQTVHVNEDIPIDSLAATGTRFQRQIRTDRVRATAGGRARSSTAGSIGTPMRGHSKSLSTSSIASVSSVSSAVYPVNHDDIRRRPPPLVMADPRSRVSVEAQYRVSGPEGGHYRPMSPTDFCTPTSATFSNGQGSPRWGSAIVSPSPSHSRAQSMYSSGSRTPGRRLSVPSSNGNPFQSPQNPNTSRTLFGTGPINASNNGFPNSQQQSTGSGLASPTTSTTSSWSRRESVSNSTDDAWRRRTWHPDTREFNNSNIGNTGVVIPVNAAAHASNGSTSAASRLSHAMVPSQYQAPPVASLPIADPSAQQTNLRLPGIESFDPVPHNRPLSPPHRVPSPMAIDSDPAPTYRAVDSPPDDRRLSGSQWDHHLQRGLNRLEIASSTPPRDSAGAWANEASHTVMTQADQNINSRPPPPVSARQTSVRFETNTRHAHGPFVGAEPPTYNRGHHHTVSAPAFNSITPRQLKRQGWYNGPVTVIPDPNNPPSEYRSPDGRQTGVRVDRMVHPNLSNGFSGFPARVPQTVPEHQPPTPTQYTHQQRNEEDADPLRRLEALVAVATSEASAATAY